MPLNPWVSFDSPDVAPWLASATDEVLDQLDFGVVEMDGGGVVQRYNATESRYSGLPPERVIGRQFFLDVAPCCNNRRVARRYEQSPLDETIHYTFALRMKPVPVVLRMLRSADAPSMYLLVRWS